MVVAVTSAAPLVTTFDVAVVVVASVAGDEDNRPRVDEINASLVLVTACSVVRAESTVSPSVVAADSIKLVAVFDVVSTGTPLLLLLFEEGFVVCVEGRLDA